jgi:hypothetical protein
LLIDELLSGLVCCLDAKLLGNCDFGRNECTKGGTKHLGGEMFDSLGEQIERKDAGDYRCLQQTNCSKS